MHDEFLLVFDGLDPQPLAPPSPGQPRNFGAPFDHVDSDITIRSCDYIDFQVHKPILRMASVVFEDMFAAPGSTPHGQGQVKQVIDLTEDSKTLLHLLSVICPMDPVVPDTFEDALSLLSACQKYQMDFTATRIRDWIRPPLFTAPNSFHAYGIASRYHLEEEALQAARVTLECSMDFNAIGEDLQFISGANLFWLYRYRNECTKVAKDCIGKMINHKPIPISSSCSYGHHHTVPRWWHSHFLLRIASRPSPRTVTDRRVFQEGHALHRTKTNCSSCSYEDKTMHSNTLCATFEASGVGPAVSALIIGTCCDDQSRLGRGELLILIYKALGAMRVPSPPIIWWHRVSSPCAN
jgi:hypothetical protein